MIQQDVIEEHPATKSAPWISNAVIAPKADRAIRMTLDARNVNKAIQASNLPIPRQENIKAKLSGAKVFSKMDFKSAFWQLELHPDSRYLTVFHANDKLYRYKRLTMGVKPAQGELNMALQPLVANILQAHLIHDDLIVTTTTNAEHNQAIEAVMNVISSAGITLNPDKCTFIWSTGNQILGRTYRIRRCTTRSCQSLSAQPYHTTTIQGRADKFPVHNAV